MTNNYDRSDKDKKYFIDGSTYNCPFCKRRPVKYKIKGQGSYNSSNTESVYFYQVRCEDCDNVSFHLSKYDLKTNKWGHFNEEVFEFPPKEYIIDINNLQQGLKPFEKEILDKDSNPKELDDVFFYHQPTSFFTIDERIPNVIRGPLNEADSSLKSNFLTGASAGLRKAIYKLLKHEKISDITTNGKFILHDDRIDKLKEKYLKIEPELFDELKAVHTLTSQELHENDWEDFDAPTLRFLINVTNVLLIEIYVAPDEAKKRREELTTLKNKAKSKKT